MKAELEAGAWKVIAEARESGTVGIFRKSGEVRSGSCRRDFNTNSTGKNPLGSASKSAATVVYQVIW